MIKFLKYILVFLTLTSCSNPSDKIKDVILYNDTIGYWNYEWPRERAEFYGATFQFYSNGNVKQYSYSKVKNKRHLFSDFGVQPHLKWGVANDSILTLMNFNSQIKVIKYNNDTIWLHNNGNNENTMLIKVKGDLNIEN
ncbi:hypothetical protein [Chryseobacterium sp. c4a]|uniref:hypothetical protein n=1 Tax=Chryseobacterium sp. c4a TaxID=1573582 RepID=UPI00135BDDB1|nr:hypothetical protein [Chryseobacterium sp. c4a]